MFSFCVVSARARAKKKKKKKYSFTHARKLFYSTAVLLLIQAMGKAVVCMHIRISVLVVGFVDGLNKIKSLPPLRVQKIRYICRVRFD